MTSPRIDFCEQANPKVLKEAPGSGFHGAARVQRSFLTSMEKRALLWLAERTPHSIHSDHLTILGFLAQGMAGASYALARGDRAWLLAVIGFLALNWLGDSLDGTLARVRRKQRPRYGFYVDHMVDSVGSLALMAGLAWSGYMHPYLALALLVAFLLLSIQSYLATYTLGQFQLSFWNFGPTELRILLAIGNLALFRWPFVLPAHYRLFDIGGIVGLAGMSLMLIYFTARNTCRLYREERLS
ncbi:MAG TPA: CDP-alcohol phosphatidyltransferase family protein [Terriglobales bacterium]|jgi:phosphatidylglycerophosphate synthase|nr:CDP-alcohol phosphatidyltransferase family protein [Terriglobales bacterium]